MSKKKTNISINEAEANNTSAAVEISAEVTAEEAAQQEITTAEAEAQVNALLEKINKAYTEGNEAEVNAIKARLINATTQLNGAEKKDQFISISATSNPILEACKLGAITLTTIKNPTEKEPSFTRNSKIEIIDFLEFTKFTTAGAAVFANVQALVYMEALNHLIFNHKLKKFGKVNKSKRFDKFNISVAAARILKVDTTSLRYNEDFIPAFQSVVDAILDGVIIDRDKVEVFMDNYTKWGKGLNGIAFAIEETFRRQIMRIMNVAITGGEWIAE